MAFPDHPAPAILTSRFDAGYLLAAELHRTQRRKGSGTPYLSHLMIVAGLVLAAGADEDTGIAALLHDAVEDQGGAGTRRLIADRFGERVARIVDGCSDAAGSPKPPWRQRKEQHIARIATEPPEVWMVVAADKLHNTRSIITDYRREGDAVWRLFRGGRDGTLWYTHAMTAALVAVAPDLSLVQDLVAATAELDDLVGGTPVATGTRDRDGTAAAH